MVLPSDETIIGFGEGRIAKNTGVVNRINSVQAARDHTRLAATAITRSRGSRAEDAQGGGNCKRDEGLVSIHGNLPFAATDRGRRRYRTDRI
jgi:hypothetical protein